MQMRTAQKLADAQVLFNTVRNETCKPLHIGKCSEINSDKLKPCIVVEYITGHKAKIFDADVLKVIC